MFLNRTKRRFLLLCGLQVSFNSFITVKKVTKKMFNLRKLVVLSVFLTLVSSKVIELHEDNWNELLSGDWMVELWVKLTFNASASTNQQSKNLKPTMSNSCIWWIDFLSNTPYEHTFLMNSVILIVLLTFPTPCWQLMNQKLIFINTYNFPYLFSQ